MIQTVNVKYPLIVVLAGASCVLSHAQDLNTTRDKTLKQVDACISRHNVLSRQCKNMKKDVQTLVDAYWEGDKTVLPTLFRVAYLGDFYTEALIRDPDGFLSSMSSLSSREQHAVEIGISRGVLGIPKERFDATRTALNGFPASSPNYPTAMSCLKVIETEDVSLLVDYFPPNTFTNLGGFRLVQWFSRELNYLEEKPLWPPTPANERTYRITALASFTGPQSITLRIPAGGAGEIVSKQMDTAHLHSSPSDAITLSPNQVAEFQALLSRARFWELPVEQPAPPGIMQLDGAQYILESVDNGKYHIVVRWCPGGTPFGDVERRLFDLAGQKRKGC